MPRTDLFALITIYQDATKRRQEARVRRVAMCALGADVSNCTHSRRHMLLRCQNPMNDYRLQLKVSIKVLMQLCLSCFVERLALAPL